MELLGNLDSTSFSDGNSRSFNDESDFSEDLVSLELLGNLDSTIFSGLEIFTSTSFSDGNSSSFNDESDFSVDLVSSELLGNLDSTIFSELELSFLTKEFKLEIEDSDLSDEIPDGIVTPL